MKKFISTILLLTVVSVSFAQQMKKRHVTPVGEKLSGVQIEWVSMNQDTLLDIVVTGTDVTGNLKIIPFQNTDIASPFLKRPVALTGMKSGSFEITDWNHDNKPDILISGKTLANANALFAFTRTNDFMFQPGSQQIVEHAGNFRVADITSDGREDIITFGTSNNIPFLKIFENKGTTLELLGELNDVFISDITVFDMNRDGYSDLIVSGHTTQNKPKTTIYYGQKSQQFYKQEVASPLNGVLTVAEMTTDAFFDLIVVGTDETGAFKKQQWDNDGDTLILSAGTPTLSQASMFTGDMTSDGQSDLLLFGRDTQLKKSNTIIEELTATTLDTTGLVTQRMGDHDRDGDLDLIQVIDSLGTNWLKFYENVTPAVNVRPDRPHGNFAVSIFKKTFIFWEPSLDDFTPALALTYDVFLGNDQVTAVAPGFDMGSRRRQVVRHGNVGTNTYMVINNLPDATYSYGVQAVDNSYMGSYDICEGGVMPCFELAHKDVQACEGTELKLAAGGIAKWFSVTNGLILDKADTLKLIAAVSDTIFSIVPQQGSCSKHRVFVVHVNKAPPQEKEIVYACKGKTTRLEIDPGWVNIEWQVTPPVNNVSFIDRLVSDPEKITVTANSQGCVYKKEFDIRLSEPVVTIDGDGFQVMRGQSAQLAASGNVETWLWEPPQGLSDPRISNPQASPLVTTEYIVTGTDSVGCTATARTTVLVQETAFIPNLFTPNGDGKNDNLMIYGLTAASNFSFKIFNREGGMVYEVSDPSKATSTGWNGAVRGTQQPSGIYHWKVEGKTTNGDKLLLNGKSSGSILLVH